MFEFELGAHAVSEFRYGSTEGAEIFVVLLLSCPVGANASGLKRQDSLRSVSNPEGLVLTLLGFLAEIRFARGDQCAAP